MTCPICDQKAMNCDCTSLERAYADRIDELEAEMAKLREELDTMRRLFAAPPMPLGATVSSDNTQGNWRL